MEHFDVRPALEQRLQVGGILVNQVIQRNQDTLGTVDHQVGGAQGELSEEAFRQVLVGAEPQVFHFIVLRLRDLFPVDMHAGVFLHALEQFHLVGVAVQRAHPDDQLEGLP